MFNIVFFITLLSLLFQGTTIPFAAKLLKVGEKAEGEVDTMGIEMPDEMGTLTNHIVTKKDLSKGNLLKDLNMPLGKRVIMIKRGDDFIMPDGGATLMEGDQMLILESYSQNET
jgi:cell volume regulation protein A